MRIAVTTDCPEEAKAIRRAVFIEEQGFVNEFDAIDARAQHAVAYCDGQPAATGRLFAAEEPRTMTIGRVAVLPAFRGRHLGQAVLTALENAAREQGADRVVLSSQCAARAFYEKCGYTACGAVYYDEHCPHIRMEKAL